MAEPAAVSPHYKKIPSEDAEYYRFRAQNASVNLTPTSTSIGAKQELGFYSG